MVTWCWGGGGVRLPWLGPGAFFLAAPAAASCSWGNWFGLLYTRGLFQEDAPLQRHVSLLSIPASGIREGGSQAHRSSSAYYKGLPSLSLSLSLSVVPFFLFSLGNCEFGCDVFVLLLCWALNPPRIGIMVDLQDRFTVGVSEVLFGDLQTLGYEGSSLSACFHHHCVLPPISITLVQSLSLSFHTLDNNLSLSVSHVCVCVCVKSMMWIALVFLWVRGHRRNGTNIKTRRRRRRRKRKRKRKRLVTWMGKLMVSLLSTLFLWVFSFFLPPSLPPFIRKILQ